MLINCPECELQVSDKAISCPHCGYPLKSKSKRSHREKSKKRIRLPNGFGRITKLNNQSLRNPYRVMVTVGKDENGKPIGKLLKPVSYFPTYNDAYAALLEYNKHPCDLSTSLTVKEVYEKWLSEYIKDGIKDSSLRTITSAWAYCESTYNIPIKDIRSRHIKYCLSDGYTIISNGKSKGEKRLASPHTKSRIKSVWNMLMDYAVEYELTDKNYARTFQISKNVLEDMDKVHRGHLTFSDEEMKTLWKNITNIEWVDVILFQCYSGWRPQELGLLKLKNVDLTNQTITGGIKTDSGIDRIVPIHPCIAYVVKKHYELAKSLNSEYLFNTTDAITHMKNHTLTYDKYRHRFDKVIKALALNPEHRAHDPRKQFVTMAKKYHVDEYAIKRMAGHAITDLTEKVYTDRGIEWLKEEISKIEKPEL